MKTLQRLFIITLIAGSCVTCNDPYDPTNKPQRPITRSQNIFDHPPKTDRNPMSASNHMVSPDADSIQDITTDETNCGTKGLGGLLCLFGVMGILAYAASGNSRNSSY